MTRVPHCILLFLFCQLSACGPGTDHKSPAATPPAGAADAVPADRTAVENTGREAPAGTPAAKAANLISPSQVGPIKIGMPVADLKKAFPDGQVKEVAITREGQGFKAYQIGQPAGLLVEETCEPACRVWRIQVQDAAYRTTEGLGIGSTLGEVKQHYPISYLGSGETEIVAVAGKQKITFMLDVSHLPARDVPRLNIQNTPDSVRVLGMLIL